MVPLNKQHCTYLKFIFEGRIYMYIVLPFGYTQAPRIFTKIIKPLVARLRTLGHVVTFYLDDSWQAANTYENCLRSCQATYLLLANCGFIPNIKKSRLIPSQIVQILGTIVNSITMTIYLPKDKEISILNLLRQTVSKHHMTVRELASVIGKLISCTHVCPLGKLYYRNLEKVKNHSLSLNMYNWDSTCHLSVLAKMKLHWWIKNLPNCSAPIVRPNPHLSISFDACSYGWGCVLNGTEAKGHFSPIEQMFSINTKELLTILYGLRSFKNEIKNCHLLLLSDNTTAVSYVCKMGGMSSDLRMKITQDIWILADEMQCWLSISHLPGVDNGEADLASRYLNDRLEWHLAPSLFRKICHTFQILPTIDLFASPLNNLLPKYVSFGPDPNCTYVDAFTISWSNEIFYAYPPFNLISRFLAKVQQDKAKGILICPQWPNQPWFPMMLNMCIQYPLLLPVHSKYMLTLPWNLNMTHPNLGNLKLLSVALSGIDTEVKDFQRTLPFTSSMDTLSQLQHRCPSKSKKGTCFVSQEKLIWCVHISTPL